MVALDGDLALDCRIRKFEEKHPDRFIENGIADCFAYGPVMLREALAAAEALYGRGFGLTVVNMPWLNRVDQAWLKETVAPFRRVFTLDDHSPFGALGDCLLNALNDLRLLGSVRFRKIGVVDIPACGTPLEVLRHHGVDAESVAARILEER